MHTTAPPTDIVFAGAEHTTHLNDSRAQTLRCRNWAINLFPLSIFLLSSLLLLYILPPCPLLCFGLCFLFFFLLTFVHISNGKWLLIDRSFKKKKKKCKNTKKYCNFQRLYINTEIELLRVFKTGLRLLCVHLHACALTHNLKWKNCDIYLYVPAGLIVWFILWLNIGRALLRDWRFLCCGSVLHICRTEWNAKPVKFFFIYKNYIY